MKAITVVLLLVFKLCISEETKDADYEKLLETSITECAEENEIDPKIVDKVWSDPDFPANNSPLKCFYHCMNVKLGITDENEILDEDNLKTLFAHYGKAEQVEEGGHCKQLQAPADGDLCETAYGLIKCIAEYQLNK